MKTTIKILIILTVFIGCISATDKINYSIDQIGYGQMIEEYLRTKTIEPTVVFNIDGLNHIDILNHKISWRELEKGVEITIDGYSISTKNKVTLNQVQNLKVDSLNFANNLQQVKIYEDYSLIGLVLTFSPCTGLGCGVNYQIIYDLKTKKQSYFGRFKTGFEFELYNFNSDNKPDYLSKTFYGSDMQRSDATEFVMYSQTEFGNFEMFKTDKQTKFWFKHIYIEFQSDLKNEAFEEEWFEKINKNGW